MSAPKRDFRTDLQALRAVAVLAVIVNHMWPDVLPGGYIGVDVFFVISGYLITSHLLRESRSTGKIRLGAFWARRARRLLPAALLVLAVCAVFTVIRLPMPVWENSLYQIGAAAVYVLNWLLASNSLDYFAQGDAQTVVTHYWSLSVEEQFYLVWPLILLVVAWLTFRRAKRTQVVVTAVAFAGIFLLSLAWATYGISHTPAATYFQTTARAWEFAAGGLIALLPVFSEVIRRRLIPLVWVGWALILGSTVLFDGQSGVPGPAALIPVVGVALVIAIGEVDHAWSPKQLTEFRPVQIVGDVSYAAYLWHWPLIVAAPWVLHRAISDQDKFTILAITFILALLTKRFVEDPVRLGPLARVRPRWILVMTVAAMAVVLIPTAAGVYTLRDRGASVAAELAAESRDPGECFGAQAELGTADCSDSRELADRSYLLASGQFNLISSTTGGTVCDDIPIDNGVLRSCSFGEPEGEQSLDIAIVGDSHAEMWSGALDTIASVHDARIHTFLKGGCAATADLAVAAAVSSPEEVAACKIWRPAMIPMIAEDPDIDVVITTARANIYTSGGQPDTGEGYVEAWNTWLDAGKHVIVIADTPAFSTTAAGCVAETQSSSTDECTMPIDGVRAETGLSLAAESMDNENFSYVNFESVFCDTVCYPVVGGIPAFFDSNHLSEYLTRSFGDEWLYDEISAAYAAE
ncbi:peptidoglycan/LPS O-acetylase OafA/YrhL [Conyzicola lurida]|uniref:Peptidoglycan/LPS O-acetylase OafA/YrhL n=1 Tax=Conyzicola lurida TaxID=1172621 RepID=A0A841AJS8_9MICO|nr:acyltransferase family protein [Conyzicola lurida]MBB5841986.1 peptidoglycan/LPS O-acetylase OafA/YrhL [Conyzicola lurida]